MKAKQLTPEQYFLKYSFPCAHVLLEMGSINQEKFDDLKKHTINNEPMDRIELMMLFPAAFRRMTEVAEKMKKDVWDITVIRKYFQEEHNNYIDEKDGNYGKFNTEFRDFCKVYKAKIINKEEDVLTVEYGGNRTRNVLNHILEDSEVGDIVTIHQGFAVEKVEE